MFNYKLSSHYKNIFEKKFNSSYHYGEYIRFLADTGNLDVLIKSLSDLDDKKGVFENSKDFLDCIVTHRLMNFYRKHNFEITIFDVSTVHDIQKYLIKNTFNYDIYLKFINEIFPKLNTSNVSHEEHMICGYILNLAVKFSYLDEKSIEKIITFFYKCRNNNKIRTEHILITILRYASDQNFSLFFKFKQHYNYVQRIFYAINTSNLIETEEKIELNSLFVKSIKKYNEFYLKTPKKIAVCISGMYRGHEQSLKEIAENIVKPLNADVFMHTWDTQADWPGIGGTASFFRLFGHENEKKIPEKYRGVGSILQIEKKFPHLFNLIKTPISQNLDQEKIKAIFPNIHIKIEDQNQFEKIYIENNTHVTDMRYKNQLKMFYGIYQSFYMALQQSLEYNFIIRIRPDVSVETFNPKIFDNLENNLFYGLSENIVGPTDVEFVCSSQMALSFINFCKNIFSKGRLNPFEQMPDVDSHRLILLWLIDNGYSLGDDVIKTKILDSRHFKAFKGLDKTLAKDISNLSKAEFLEEADLIEFFAKIVE